MKIRPYSPVAMPGNRPNVRNSRQQPAISTRFEDSSNDIPVLPLLIGCAGGLAFLFMVAACMVSDSRRFRSWENNDPSNGIYTPGQDTFELSTRREPIVVHDNWNNSDVTINAEQHSNVLLREYSPTGTRHHPRYKQQTRGTHGLVAPQHAPLSSGNRTLAESSRKTRTEGIACSAGNFGWPSGLPMR